MALYTARDMMANKNLPDEPLDSPKRRRLPPLLRRCWYGLNQTFRRRIAHLAITPDQFTILRNLQEREPEGMTQYELATIMTSDPNTISSLLKRMSAAGLVKRKRYETDRRAMQVRSTTNGTRLYEEARQIALDLQGHLLDKIPEARREQFLADLEALADAAIEASRKTKDGADTPELK